MQIFPSQSEYKALRQKARRIPIVVQAQAPGCNPTRLFQKLYGDATGSFIFESGNGPEETSRYSFWGHTNGKIISLNRDRLEIRNNGSSRDAHFNSLEQLEELEFDLDIPAIPYLDHFWGGWVGYLGYEMGQWFENFKTTSQQDSQCPDFLFMQVETVWVFDHQTQTLKLILSKENDLYSESEYDSLVLELSRTWNQTQDWIAKTSATVEKIDNVNSPNNSGNGLQSNLSLDQYKTIVDRAKNYIEEGDIYQANLAQRFEMEFKDDPFRLYEKLRDVNPSPFSGYLCFQDFSLASSSPERLVKVDGHHIETRPIAGTRPRGTNRKEDEALSEELLLNEKEKAEHLMLVDLERNDLGRICETGSVQVTSLMFLEKYSHVIHIVSNIEGKLKPSSGVRDILRAVFPGGTITGCPKIRCMEIINELEPSPRGPYSGSFGYIGFSKHLDLNIIIRTIIIQEGRASFHVGAGIVADSVAENEYRETLDKAAAMVNALTGGTL